MEQNNFSLFIVFDVKHDCIDINSSLGYKENIIDISQLSDRQFEKIFTNIGQYIFKHYQKAMKINNQDQEN